MSQEKERESEPVYEECDADQYEAVEAIDLVREVSDDEETIEQEEQLETEVTPGEELKLLAEDMNMSVEELKATWALGSRRKRISSLVDSSLGSDTRPSKVMKLTSNDTEQMNSPHEGVPGPSSVPNQTPNDECTNSISDNVIDSTQEENYTLHLEDSSSDEDSTESLGLEMLYNCSLDGDEEKDKDYKPYLVMNKNEIRTGQRYQADIPPGPSTSSGIVESTPDDTCVWSPPDDSSPDFIEEYIIEAKRVVAPHLYSLERVLYVLWINDFDDDASLRQLVRENTEHPNYNDTGSFESSSEESPDRIKRPKLQDPNS